MRLRSGIESKTCQATEPGEWIRLDTPVGTAIGWVVAKRVPAGREIIFFDISGNEPPRIINWDGDSFCLSFGMDCVIDPIGVTEKSTNRTEFIERPGVLSIGKAGMYLTAVETRSPWNDVVGYDILTGALRQNFNQSEVIFPRWKVWESDAARLSGTAEPILDFTALPRA